MFYDQPFPDFRLQLGYNINKLIFVIIALWNTWRIHTTKVGFFQSLGKIENKLKRNENLALSCS